MATKKAETFDTITTATPVQENKFTVPRTRVFLPPLEEEDAVKGDPYEHVTINGVTTLVRRGEYVDVTIPVYIQLRNRYPRI